MTTPLSSSIRDKIVALDALVSTLGSDFDREAEDAVAGVADAGERAAGIDQRLARLAVDRRILARALDRAIATEAAVFEASAEASRRAHMATARNHAAQLVEVAGRVDSAIAALASALPELTVLEGEVRRSLHKAQHDFVTSIVGRAGVQVLAVDGVNALIDGRARMRGPAKPLTDVVAHAWAFLLEDENHG